jgi:hypothetical protein
MFPQIPLSWANVPAQALLSLGTAAYLFFYFLGISVQFLIRMVQKKQFDLLRIAISLVIGFAGSIFPFVAISFFGETKVFEVFRFISKEELLALFALFSLGSDVPRFSLLMYIAFFRLLLLKPLIVMLASTLLCLYVSKDKWKNPIIRGSFYIQAIICIGFIGMCLNYLILEYIGPFCFPSVFELPSVFERTLR